MKYFLALGSNTGNRRLFMTKAIEAVGQVTRIVHRSALYESTPYGVANQGEFLNAVLQIESVKRPFRLLRILKQIECRLGRQRSQRWGPRCIDLDILDWSGPLIQEKILQIPHAGLPKRRFVLIPLGDIRPVYRDRQGRSPAELLRACEDMTKVRLYEKHW